MGCVVGTTELPTALAPRALPHIGPEGRPGTGPNDLRLGALAWEGDQELTGDQMKVKSNLSGSPTTVDPAGPAGTSNFFDSGKQPTALQPFDPLR